MLVTIAIIGYPYTFVDRNLTHYHNSWTADAVVIFTTVIISNCSINLGLSVIKFRYSQPTFFLNDLVPQSIVTWKTAVLVLYQQSLPLFGMDVCTHTLRSAAPPSGGPPPSTSNWGRDLGLCSCYMIMRYVSVYVYTIWGQYHLTIQVKLGCPTGCIYSLNLSPAAAKVHHPLVLYAAQLTQLLALPLWVPHCLYS